MTWVKKFKIDTACIRKLPVETESQYPSKYFWKFKIRGFRRLSNLNIERLLYLEVNSLRFIYNLFYLKKLNRGNYPPLASNQISREKGEEMFYLKRCDLIRCLRSLRHMLSRGSFCKVPYGKRISVQSVTKVHLCKSKYAHAYVYIHIYI